MLPPTASGISVRAYLRSIPVCVDGFDVEEDGLDFAPWEMRQSKTEKFAKQL